MLDGKQLKTWSTGQSNIKNVASPKYWATQPNCGNVLLGSYYQNIMETLYWQMLTTFDMVKMYEIEIIRSQAPKLIIIRVWRRFNE